MKKYAVIVAGGSGIRMGTSQRKQYLPIAGRPILMHTISQFYKYDAEVQLILVIPMGDFDYWKQLCRDFNFDLPHHLIEGGESRFQSVKNGLNAIEEKEGLVAIHDGVRPFVSPRVISESFLKAMNAGSAIAVISLKDSIREVLPDGESAFRHREDYRLVQTPQTFHLHKIKKAFEVEEQPAFTDDATVYEYQGWKVSLIEGEISNIKITTPEDIAFAEFLLNRREN